MANPPSRRFTGSAREAAEAAFKSATTKPAAPAPAAKPAASLPAAREMVTLRLDRAVLEHFQQEGPGWQDRINLALRKAAGL
ncbi:BrnA antitoxin family protein [Ancylobacter lacus]|uniref:BrnA antitoxin family protein n=1 Tax=Ancylobacter lacus TaxID=2579970 RepID=UPI001BCFBF6E|nr:BrnA antitoxin family protein [Ancylobacter lacus]MBS7540069.1 BrnA antitoxin family protein [Ancylobacter lacus]